MKKVQGKKEVITIDGLAGIRCRRRSWSMTPERIKEDIGKA